MGKRAAENQLTKDGADDAGSGDEEQQSGSQGSTAPIEGRVIRGLPKRKGLGGAPAGAAQATAAAPANPFASFGTPPSAAPAAAPAFSFGAPAASAPPAAASPFSFGGAAGGTSAPPKAATPFAGFNFGASTSASTPAPAAPATEQPKASPFSAFQFGQPSKPAASAAAPAQETAAPKPSAAPFSGFSFKPSAAAPAAPAQQAEDTPAQSAAPAPKSNPFSSFSFGASSAPKQPEASTSKVYPDLPKETAPAAAASKPASEVSGMPKPPLPGSFTFGNASASSAATKSFNPPTTKLDGMPAPPTDGFSFGASSSAKPDGLPKPAAGGFSFGASAPPKAAPIANGSTSAVTPSSKTDVPGADNLKYLTSVRGLNHSLAQALVHKVQTEPFCDLAEILDRLRSEYDQHLASIEEKAGIEGSKRKRQRTNGVATPNGAGSSLNVRSQPSPAPAPAPSVPQATQPTKSQDVTASDTESASQSQSAVPTAQDQDMEDTEKRESAPAKQPEATTSSPAISIFRDILKQSSAPSESASTADTVMGTPGAPSAKLGAASNDTPGSSNKRKSAIFSITPTVKPASSNSTTPSGTPSKPSALASFNLGSGGSPAPSGSSAFGMPPRPRTVSTGFSFGSASADKAPAAFTTEPAKPAFSFGGSSTFNFSASPATAAPAAASSTPPADPFATDKGSSAPAPFSFGAPAAPTASASTSSIPNLFATSSKPAFSFGSATTSAAPTPPPEPAADQNKEDADAADAPADQGPDLSKVIAPAKGEEDEDTVWQSTARLLRKVDKDGKATWAEAQEAYIKINRLRGTGGVEDEENASLMRRIIVRNVATGKLILNFSLKNLLALAAMTKQSAIRFSIPNAEGKIEMYLFAFSKEESAPAKAAACLRAIQKERRGLGLNDFSQLPQ